MPNVVDLLFLFVITMKIELKKHSKSPVMYHSKNSALRIIQMLQLLNVTIEVYYHLVFWCFSIQIQVRRLIGTRVIDSSAYCNQISLVPVCLNSTRNTFLDNWIIRLLSSILCWPKVILLCGGHCFTCLLLFLS